MQFDEIDEIKKDIASQVNNDNNQITGEDKAKALLSMAKEPVDMVRLAVSDKIANKVKTDQETISRIDRSADKLVDSGVTTIENEAEASQNKSEKDKLDTYFEKHKEELRTAGIDKVTYLEDMERGVKWHKRWSNVHWFLFGWWLTGIRTFIMRAKPFKIVLNILAIMISCAVLVAAGFGVAALIRLIARQ